MPKLPMATSSCGANTSPGSEMAPVEVNSVFCAVRKTGARRGRQRPPGAKGSAVGAARRLRCDARSGVVRPNSLRSLRSLRSDRRRKSDHEARAARAPTPPLRFSPPLNSPRAGAACHDESRPLYSASAPPLPRQRTVRAGCSAIGRRRASQQARPRAYPRASSSNSSPMSERRERSERSELGDGPQDRASQGSRPAGPTAEDKRRRLPARDFARANVRMRTTATRRQPTLAP